MLIIVFPGHGTEKSGVRSMLLLILGVHEEKRPQQHPSCCYRCMYWIFNLSGIPVHRVNTALLVENHAGQSQVLLLQTIVLEHSKFPQGQASALTSLVLSNAVPAKMDGRARPGTHSERGQVPVSSGCRRYESGVYQVASLVSYLAGTVHHIIDCGNYLSALLGYSG